MAKDAFKKLIKVLRNRNVSLTTKTKLLKRNTRPDLRQRKLEDLFKEEEDTRGQRNVLLQKDADDIMDPTRKQLRGSEEDANKKTVLIS